MKFISYDKFDRNVLYFKVSGKNGTQSKNKTDLNLTLTTVTEQSELLLK